jgi:hypothetical protein
MAEPADEAPRTSAPETSSRIRNRGHWRRDDLLHDGLPRGGQAGHPRLEHGRLLELFRH